MSEPDEPMSISTFDMRSGVNEKGEAFCRVLVTSRDGVVMEGQLSPTEMRHHANVFFSVAEAAEQDAATLRVIRKLDLPDGLAAGIITELRESRVSDPETGDSHG